MAKKIVPKHEPEVQKAKHAGGRPTTFKPEYVEQAYKLCELGHTDFEIAQFFDITYRGFIKWKQRYPKLVQALNLAKAVADTRVGRSLYSRAVGFHYEAVKVFMPAGAKKPIYAPYMEYVIPDPTSAIFWLKNRDPAHWRDAWQVEHTLGKYLISDKPMTEDEWAKERATLIDVTPEDEKKD
jgi:hypothetical protein